MITESLGGAAGNGYRVLEFLYENPIVSVTNVKQLTGTTFPTANKLVSKFVEKGILKEITGQVRNRSFLYEDYIALFQETESAESESTETENE